MKGVKLAVPNIIYLFSKANRAYKQFIPVTIAALY